MGITLDCSSWSIHNSFILVQILKQHKSWFLIFTRHLPARIGYEMMHVYEWDPHVKSGATEKGESVSVPCLGTSSFRLASSWYGIVFCHSSTLRMEGCCLSLSSAFWHVQWDEGEDLCCFFPELSVLEGPPLWISLTSYLEVDGVIKSREYEKIDSGLTHLKNGSRYLTS